MRKTLLASLLIVATLMVSIGALAAPIEPNAFTKWMEENAVWRTATNVVADDEIPAGLITDPSGAPTDEALQEILHFASLAVTSGGRADWFLVAVKDAEEQKAIIGERHGITSEGTVTILVMTERSIKTELRTDEVAAFNPDRGYYNAGIVSGYLNIAAISKGYATRFFMTPALPGTNGFNDGERGLDVAKYIEGTTYIHGTTEEATSTENMKFVCAIVIGTPNTELETYTTDHNFPENFIVWDK